MFGNKPFDARARADEANNIIINGVRYVDTRDLYKLIFKRISDLHYTEDDMHKHHSQDRVLNNKGYKYIIAR